MQINSLVSISLPPDGFESVYFFFSQQKGQCFDEMNSIVSSYSLGFLGLCFLAVFANFLQVGILFLQVWTVQGFGFLYLILVLCSFTASAEWENVLLAASES